MPPTETDNPSAPEASVTAMTTTAPHPGSAARTDADDFLDLVLSDDDLVDAEFAAIVEAGWRQDPPADDGDGDDGHEAKAGEWRPTTPRESRHRGGRLGPIERRQQVRQRSPPLAPTQP